MDETTREQIEAEARKLCQEGAFERAVTLALRGYGPEVLTFLSSRHRGSDEADEVFSLFAQALWKAMPGFEWASTLRTFAYGIARRTSLHYQREAARHRQRRVGDEETSALMRVAAEVRTETARIYRTEVKNRFAELRASLAPEDQELLILRVDRNLSWLELAEVLREEGAPPLDGETLKREAARLRKRFQLVKEKLREMARREGLILGGDDE